MPKRYLRQIRQTVRGRGRETRNAWRSVRARRAIYATPRPVSDLSLCHFYHTMDLPHRGEVLGEWDLRPGVDAYLGNIELLGRRVLEVGPANGYLTFHMERQGADVVAVEVSDQFVWDFVPQSGLDMQAILAERRDVMERVKNGFWLAHREVQSRARVHYGTAYRLPDQLGRFDIAVMAAVLLHNRDPLQIVANCAARSDQLVIVELWTPELADGADLRLEPSVENGCWDTWWRFSPRLFTQFLEVLGFTEFALTHHAQRRHEHDIQFFTLVASRP